jgi:hypothetical protein
MPVGGEPHPDDFIAMGVQGDAFDHAPLFGYPRALNDRFSGGLQAQHMTTHLLIDQLLQVGVVLEYPEGLYVESEDAFS